MQQVTEHAQTINSPSSSASRRPWRFLPALAIVAISVICYANTISGYFYSDDFPFLKLVGAVDTTGLGGVLKTFFGTRCADFQAFLYCYRPLPDVIFLIEYLLAGVKPFWYHVANIACHAGCALLVYAIGARILRHTPQPKLIAFIGATLFATCPIYGEIIFGPTNIVSGSGALFFLASFALYLRWLDQPSRKALAGSVLFFALSLFSKELAAILPVVLACLCVKEHRSLRSLIPFAAVFAIYLAIRTAVLGPILGGYVGILGDLNHEGWKDRFFSPWPIYCLFPLHVDAFGPSTPLRPVLTVAYLALGVLAALRFKDRTRPSIKFEASLLGLWMLLSLVPVYSVWNIEPGLAGGRHAHVSAMPFFLLAALLTYSAKRRREWLAAWSVICAVFVYADIRNNQIYVQASQETYKVKQALDAQMSSLKPGQRLFFLNPPFRAKGLYLFNTAIMFRAMCSPPVSAAWYNDRILLPSQWFNANYDHFSLARVKSLTEDPTIKAVVWNEAEARIEPLDMHLGTGSQSINLTPVFRERNQFQQFARYKYLFDPKFINSELDFVEFDLSCKATPKAPKGVQPAVSVHWQTVDLPHFTADNVLCSPVTTDGVTRHFRFALSNSMRWWLQKKNGSLEIRMPSAGFENQLTNVRALGWRLRAPSATITDAPADGDGVHEARQSSFTLNYNAHLVENANAVIVEVSRPDSILEEGIVTGRRDYSRPGKAMIRREIPITPSTSISAVAFGPKDFARHGTYEIEVGTIDKDGKLGYFSDPLFVRILGKNGERTF